MKMMLMESELWSSVVSYYYVSSSKGQTQLEDNVEAFTIKIDVRDIA